MKRMIAAAGWRTGGGGRRSRVGAEPVDTIQPPPFTITGTPGGRNDPTAVGRAEMGRATVEARLVAPVLRPVCTAAATSFRYR